MPIIAILVVVGLLLLCVVGGLVGLLLPAISAAREAARRSACSNNLRQIGLGLHAYTDVWASLPPAYTVDTSGRPLHSWRVLILPFMDYGGLYDQIRLDEPWDSPHNAALAAQMPVAFRCPSHEEDGQFHTHYLAVVGPDTVFTGTESPRLSSILDGLSNTIAVVESTESAHWMEPRDMAFEGMSFTINDPGGRALGSEHPGGVSILMCDDSVRFLLDDTLPETVRQLLLRDDGAIVEQF